MDIDVDVDLDIDMDVDAGGGLETHGGGFSLLSMFSLLSFMMGAGWMGLACRIEWDLGPLPSAGASGGFGFFLMFLSSFGMYQMKKLNQIGKYDVRTCIGEMGQVYLRIPAKGQGRGQIQINVGGSRKILILGCRFSP